MSASSIRRIHLLGFVNEVRHIHETMPDRRFCFVLGAGASKPSGIRTAGELGLEWLKKLHTEVGGTPEDFTKWLSEGGHGIAELPANTGITDIAAIAAAYPAIYQKKWGHDRAQGHAEIERQIEAAKPSYGYYALAEILASDDPAPPSRHNVVITPNFDNLPAEVLGALGKKVPIIIGHSAIAEFARPTLRRPLIIKFHHDFLLAPKSAPKDVNDLEDGYSNALSEIFRLYTPIVVGYGGNDGSLMGFLENLPAKSIPGGILWCWRTGDPPSARIESVVSKQAGTLVEISGFDELMTLLEAPFGHVFNPDKLSERAAERAKELTTAKQLLTKKTESSLWPAAAPAASGESRSAPVLTATASAESSALLDALTGVAGFSGSSQSTKKRSPSWWHWQNRINATLDLDEKERLFEEAVKATNHAPQLLSNFASFLTRQRKDHIRAEAYYLKAIATEPDNVHYLGNYAAFVHNQGKDDVRAEEYYLKAIAADPNHAQLLGNYAVFLQNQRKDDARAEEYYIKSIAADPNDANNLGNYAVFLQNHRKDNARAEEYYVKAIAADPNHANNLTNYAIFIQKELKDDARAEEYYLKAIAADPNRANTLGTYALFLQMRCKDDARAEDYYLKTLAADPNHAYTLGNYVQFLIGCSRFNEAAHLAKRVWAQLTDQNDMVVIEVAFSRWLLAAVSGTDGGAALGRLKTLLQGGYSRAPWSFDSMLAACLPKLSEEQGRLARHLAAAILDETKLADLDADPIWTAVQPIPTNTPWPDDPVSESGNRQQAGKT